MSRRAKKVQSLISNELSVLLLTEVSDPTLQNSSITEVQLTDDLKSARVYFTLRGEGKPDAKLLREIQKGFVRAAPFLRRELGRRLELRAVPELEFFYDEHVQEVVRVMNLLDEVKGHTQAPTPEASL